MRRELTSQRTEEDRDQSTLILPHTVINGDNSRTSVILLGGYYMSTFSPVVSVFIRPLNYYSNLFNTRRTSIGMETRRSIYFYRKIASNKEHHYTIPNINYHWPFVKNCVITVSDSDSTIRFRTLGFWHIRPETDTHTVTILSHFSSPLVFIPQCPVFLSPSHLSGGKKKPQMSLQTVFRQKDYSPVSDPYPQ